MRTEIIIGRKYVTRSMSGDKVAVLILDANVIGDLLNITFKPALASIGKFALGHVCVHKDCVDGFVLYDYNKTFEQNIADAEV